MSQWHAVQDVLAGRLTGRTVRLRGWVHRQRSGGKIAFLALRDGTGVVQCTVKSGIADDDSLQAAKNARIESSVSLLEGTVVADERAPGGHEIQATHVEVHQFAEDFPLRGGQGTEFELDNRHLWLRSTQLSTVFRVKHRLLLAIRRFFDGEGFVETDPSVITTNACEGGSTLFEFDYFGQTAYLSQSAQMYLEGLIFGLPKVYSITNSFRAEKSRTSKHLTEFHHLEAECAWVDNEQSLRFQERLVVHLAHDLARHCAQELETLGQDPERLLRIGAYVEGESAADEEGLRFGRMTYRDAAERLRELGHDFPEGEDFGAPHEKALTEGRTNPLFITDWPARIKAFYMHERPEDPSLVACADLLGPDGFGELIGGSQRSEDIPSMQRRLLEQVRAEVAADHPGLADMVPIATDAERVEAAFEAQPGRVHDVLDEVARRAPLAADWKVRDLLQGPEAIGPLRTWERLEQALLESYTWYFDLRRFGSVPHSGFGLGIERLLRWFTGQEHIRDMVPYPRTPSRAYP